MLISFLKNSYNNPAITNLLYSVLPMFTVPSPTTSAFLSVSSHKQNVPALDASCPVRAMMSFKLSSPNSFQSRCVIYFLSAFSHIFFNESSINILQILLFKAVTTAVASALSNRIKTTLCTFIYFERPVTVFKRLSGVNKVKKVNICSKMPEIIFWNQIYVPNVLEIGINQFQTSASFFAT